MEQPAIYSDAKRLPDVRLKGSFSLPDELESAAEEAVEVFGEGLLFGDSLLDGFFSGRSLVAEIDECGKHVIDGCALHDGWCGGDGEVFQFVFQFHNKALGELFAYAGNAGELGVILGADGLHGSFRRKAAKHLDGELGADAADGDQPLEEALLFAVEEAEEGDLVVADLGVDVQRGLRADRGQRGEGGHGDDDVVAHARSLDDGLTGLFVDELAAQVSDHWVLL